MGSQFSTCHIFLNLRSCATSIHQAYKPIRKQHPKLCWPHGWREKRWSSEHSRQSRIMDQYLRQWKVTENVFNIPCAVFHFWFRSCACRQRNTFLFVKEIDSVIKKKKTCQVESRLRWPHHGSDFIVLPSSMAQSGYWEVAQQLEILSTTATMMLL